MEIPTKSQISSASRNVPNFINPTLSPHNNILSTIGNNINNIAHHSMSPTQHKKAVKKYINHESYWDRNRTAIIWFIVIIVVIIIIIIAVLTTDNKKCSNWFKYKR